MKPATRWITIGSVERRFVVLGNCGYPGGLRIRWQGRVDWCQPFDFSREDQLLAAVRIRLGIARLEAVALASAVPSGGWQGRADLLCLVKRQSDRVR